jgi:TetR/AcrR family transcriptional regulator, regulator of cefoperazone and chloramphenicol sensitivity
MSGSHRPSPAWAPSEAEAPKTPRERSERPEGDTRGRLLRAALRLFAAQGFVATSTRDIAEAAQANVAAISYHFGDKAGLYAAAFTEPFGDPAEDVAALADPELTLPEALRLFLAGFVEPLRADDISRDCVKLHFREMLEPSGLWQQELELGIRPSHEALVKVLRRHLGLAEADQELHRLALAIAGLGVHLHVGREVADTLAPALHVGPHAVDDWAASLLRYAMAMVHSEAERRQRLAATFAMTDPSSQGNAGPPQVSLSPSGGGPGAARPGGPSEER